MAAAASIESFKSGCREFAENMPPAKGKLLYARLQKECPDGGVLCVEVNGSLIWTRGQLQRIPVPRCWSRESMMLCMTKRNARHISLCFDAMNAAHSAPSPVLTFICYTGAGSAFKYCVFNCVL